MTEEFANIITIAIAQNQQLLNSPARVGPPMHGKMLRNGQWIDCIDIHLKGNEPGDIPTQITAALDDGRQVNIPVNIIAGMDDTEAQSIQGNTVDATATNFYKGTVCCMVNTPDNINKLLTCSHVMLNGSGENNFGPLDDPIDAEIAGMPGRFVWAKCDINFDMALVEPDDPGFTYMIPPGNVRPLSSSDIGKTISIVKQGGNIKNGTIKTHCVADEIPIRYTEGFTGMVNLIVLSDITANGDQISYTTLTKSGDSGACVYDELNNPIGMIIAGDNMFSYAISMAVILNELDATLIN